MDLYVYPSATLGEVEVGNGTTLEYSVGSYEILVFDSLATAAAKKRGGSGAGEGGGGGGVEPTRVSVYDHWTLAEVRDEYSQQSGQPVLDSEKFLTDERQLEEGVPLWKLRIRVGEQLVIERLVDDVAVDYICGDCGVTVPLKAADEVKCRKCFHPILFKKRTGRVCQFNCR